MSGTAPLLAAEAAALDVQLAGAREQLQTLDQLAQQCLQSPVDNNSADAPCQQFRLALNGPELSAYLDNCRTLKAWRDALVTATVTSADRTAATDAETLLNQMMNVEYYCGENALLQRTRFVEAAYGSRLIRDRALASDVGSLARQFDELRQNSLIDSERQRLLQNVQDMQQQQQRNVQESQDRQELELLRQQQQRQNPQ